MSLNPDRISELLRCGRRLRKAELFVRKTPCLVTCKPCVSFLIVRVCHQRDHENDVKETLTELRSRFWIRGEKQVVTKILHIDARSIADSKGNPSVHACRAHIQNHKGSTVYFQKHAGSLYIKKNGNMSKTSVSIFRVTQCTVYSHASRHCSGIYSRSMHPKL